ncbi:MAG: carbohydrate ABC transporter permease, partial [Gaiellaceae bacterium]
MSTASVALEAQFRRRRRRRIGGQVLKYAALAFAAVIVLMPVYVLLVASFKSGTEADPSRAWALPEVWSLDAWREAWNGEQYGL